MSRLYCQHLVPMDGIETCIECEWAIRSHWMAGEGVIEVKAARAWQALRDWCNGTPEEWAKTVTRAWKAGREYGREDVR
jgi:predicted Rdx family selenoprotein